MTQLESVAKVSSRGRDHRYLHTGQCTQTSEATSNSGTPVLVSSSVWGVLQSESHGKGLQSVCVGLDFEVCISSLGTGADCLCSTTPRSALFCWWSPRALMLPQLQVPLSLCSGFPCICRTGSSVLCLSVLPLLEYALQGTLVKGGRCSHCQKLRFCDQLFSTMHSVCPQYVWGGDKARSRIQPDAKTNVLDDG